MTTRNNPYARQIYPGTSRTGQIYPRTSRTGQPRRKTGSTRKIPASKRMRRRLHRLAVNLFILFTALFSVFLIFLTLHVISLTDFSGELFSHAPKNSPIKEPAEAETPASVPHTGIPKELRELLKHNPETQDFIAHYADRDSYLDTPIDLSADTDLQKALDNGEVPLLMQWDLRWGYAPYGNEMIGLAGCGPTCLSMTYIYLTKDTSMDPDVMSEFAYQNGYYTTAGTDWALWTDGVKQLGLTGETLSLSESAIKSILDNGGVVICSMRPGDFTTTGHIILIRGYDENGFYVNDPNRKSNSNVQWTYQKISPQIKNLWGIQKSAP